MSDGELKVTINRDPKKPDQDSFLEAQKKSEEIREKRQQAHREADQQAAQPASPAELPEMPDPLPEDIESLQVELPNGLIVDFGPPPGVSMTMRLIRLLGDRASETMTNLVYRILLSVRAIDGEAMPPINDVIQAEKLANRIGDKGIDVLSILFNRHWMSLKQDDLKVLKKNQRKP